MKKRFRSLFHFKDQRGVVAILVGIMMVMLISFVALAIDIGYGLVTRNELQNIADAAALAAARQLGVNYEGMSYEDQQEYVCDPSEIIPVAQAVAAENRAGGKGNIVINDDDVTIGQWDASSKTLTPGLDQPDAVRVIARRDDSANGPITTFFARIFGKETVNVVARATAALTGQSTSGEGGLPIPVGLSKYLFEHAYCDQPIRFYPTNDPASCGGWHVFTDEDSYDANAHDLGELLNALENQEYESPETQAGETEFQYTGGTLASVFDDMKALFDTMKVLNDGVLDNDEDPNTWTTAVVVYQYPDPEHPCANPNQVLTVIGFAQVTITEILEAPEKIINAVIKCDFVEPGRGGGGDFGTKGSIPGLVQ